MNVGSSTPGNKNILYGCVKISGDIRLYSLFISRVYLAFILFPDFPGGSQPSRLRKNEGKFTRQTDLRYWWINKKTVSVEAECLPSFFSRVSIPEFNAIRFPHLAILAVTPIWYVLQVLYNQKQELNCINRLFKPQGDCNYPNTKTWGTYCNPPGKRGRIVDKQQQVLHCAGNTR